MPRGLTEHRPNGTTRPVPRALIEERAIALEFNGLAYAVMMATPADLEDFATGFALTEGLAKAAPDITAITTAQVPDGWVVRAQIPGLSPDSLAQRVRTRVAESSCGLCGVESLEAAMRPLPPVAPHPPIAAAAIFAALAALPPLQVLGRATGAAHAAAHVLPSGEITLLREDVGRHNAVDKLVGAAARARTQSGLSLADGFLLSTARCSFEIVEKAVRAGATSLVTISLPTALAAERAATAGLSLWALARPDSVLRITGPA